MKPSGALVAQKAVEIWTRRPTYKQMDCQAFVEQAVKDAGGRMDYAGSNDMARNAVCWTGTIENAKIAGKLVPGAGLLIHEDDESGLPAKYRGDGLGDFSHVGLYLGDEYAVSDKPKGSIINKKCDCVHSSSSMGRVAGTTLKNGWTHVVWFKEIDYGVEAKPGVELGYGLEENPAKPYDDEGFENEDAPAENSYESEPAVVFAENGKPVKLRKRPSTSCSTYWNRNVGTAVEVLEHGDNWCKVRSRSRVGYMMTKFLMFNDEVLSDKEN